MVKGEKGDVGREGGMERSPYPFAGQRRTCAYMRHLCQRMHPGVRPSAAYDGHRLTQHNPENPLQFALNGQYMRRPTPRSRAGGCAVIPSPAGNGKAGRGTALGLPACVACPVVGDRELESPHISKSVTSDKL